MSRFSTTSVWLPLLGVFLAAIPLCLYWQMADRWPRISAAEAKSITSRLDSTAILIDIRSPEQFNANHVLGAENWPVAELVDIKPGDPVLRHFKGKTALVLSEGGIDAGGIFQRLSALSVDAKIVEGGMESWIAAAKAPCAFALSRGGTTPEDLRGFYFSPMSLFEQFIAVFAAFVMKPLYMIIAFAAIVVLRRRRAADLRAIRAALVFFLVAESACAANYLAFGEESLALDYLHNVAMPCAFGLAIWAILEGVDRRLVKYSLDQACTAVGLCGGCVKDSNAHCALERLFMFVTPAAAAFAFMPLSAHTHMVSYNTAIWGAVYSYSRPMVIQLQEARYLPIVALGFLGASFAVLTLREHNRVPLSKVLFAAGAGVLAFSLSRTTLFALYSDNLVWASFWEEAGEFVFASGVAYTLWVFRKGLAETGPWREAGKWS